MSIRVGILGASGYMGGEALRILLEHPEVEIAWATSRTRETVEYFHRNLLGSDIRFIDPSEISPCDVVFCALPSGKSVEMAPKILEWGAKLIDLGSDFRLNDLATWESVYKRKHPSWELSEEAVYGIPELHREEIKQARVVANPGCFSSAAILGLAPLVGTGLIDNQKIVVDGLSGTAGAGAELDITAHHPEISNNIVSYNVVNHRHTYEIEQELGIVATNPVTVHFTSSYVPISRGIHAICHVFLEEDVSRDDILAKIGSFYKNETFIKVFEAEHDPEASWQYRPYPWVAATSGTNYCHIGVDVDRKRKRAVIFSVLDSVGKGGAHAGIQNMNLLFGIKEDTGLGRFGNHPY